MKGYRRNSSNVPSVTSPAGALAVLNEGLPPKQ